MNFTDWNFYFLHQHSHLSPTNCLSPLLLHISKINQLKQCLSKLYIIIYAHKHNKPPSSHAYESTCLQKSQRTWRNNTIKKGAQKTYKSAHQYYSFYTRFLLVHVGFQKPGKTDLKKTITLLSCIK